MKHLHTSTCQNVFSCSCGGTHTPDPVDHQELLVQLQHVDDKEDGAKDHLTDGHGSVASIQRGSITDEDYQAEDLGKTGDKIRKTKRKKSSYFQVCLETGLALAS